MGNPTKEKNEKHAAPSAKEKGEKGEKNAKPSGKEKNEKHGEPSAPLMNEMLEDERPEKIDLDSSTVTYRPGLGFRVTGNLKPFNENLMVEGIKKILIKYTAGTWFKSSSAAKDIQILNIEYSWTHVYQLQCYNQMRQVKEKSCGYRGGPIDDQSFGPIPGMWDIQPAFIPEDFQKSKEKTQMPHSQTVRTCWNCSGDGYKYERINYKDSKGKTRHKTVKVTCFTCSGYGKLLSWLQLKIEWMPTLYCQVSSDSKIKKKRLRRAQGHYIFENKDTKVLPVEYVGGSSMCEEVTQFTANALAEHEKTLLINQVSIRQRQTIKVVPIAECHYRYKDQPLKTFYLFGKDRKEIYAPSFPSNAACSLM